MDRFSDRQLASKSLILIDLELVGTAGFEPTTSTV